MHTFVVYCCILATTTKWDHVSLFQIFDPSTLVYICLQSSSDSSTLVYIRLLHSSSDSSIFIYGSSTFVYTHLVTSLHSSTFVCTRLVTRLHSPTLLYIYVDSSKLVWWLLSVFKIAWQIVECFICYEIRFLKNFFAQDVWVIKVFREVLVTRTI